MTEFENLLEGSITYKSENNEQTYTREIEEEIMLVKFTGDISDLPREIKRNLTVQKAERFEEGDMIILEDDYVRKFNYELEKVHVKAADTRKNHEIDFEECAINDLYCPHCGDRVWKSGKPQGMISCGDCMAHFDVYGKGESLVIESRP